MIRRHLGRRWLLFTQHDHAQLARDLAEHVGNARFARPEPREPVLAAIGLHDAGWPLHDDAPTLNSRGEPLDVFESPHEIALEVWTASARRAAEVDPYAGLLTSIHVLNLSIYATGHAPINHAKWDISDPRKRFAVNQFQHDQIELQERLRGQLGLHTDRPLKHGLAEGWTEPRERALACHFRLLQAMDLLSLNLCCTEVVAPVIQNVIPGPDERPIMLAVRRLSDEAMQVNPWPFDVPAFEVAIPYRAVPAQPFASREAFLQAWQAAPMETFQVTVSAG